MSLPELLSAPLSSVDAQPETLMAAAPVRHRSGPGGPRAQLPPCYYEGYLEKRGPKEKVCRGAKRGECHVVALRVEDGGGRCGLMPADPPFPVSCQLPHCENGRGDCLVALPGILHVNEHTLVPQFCAILHDREVVHVHQPIGVINLIDGCISSSTSDLFFLSVGKYLIYINFMLRVVLTIT